MGPSDRGRVGQTTRWVARVRVCDEDHPTPGLRPPVCPRYTGAQAPTNVSPGGTAGETTLRAQTARGSWDGQPAASTGVGADACWQQNKPAASSTARSAAWLWTTSTA
nr:MAG TPA: hypothetical protein [Caudoviricetes sp.]